MTFPWDAHAAKDLVCIDCHFSPNNPGRMIHEDAAKNLAYQPGQNDIAVYLKRPNHNFARGNIPPQTVNVRRHNTMRGCEDCHDAEKSHTFLPCKNLHFKALACQTCHIPAVHFWAYRSDEWGFLMDTGTSRITFRGIEGNIVDPDSKASKGSAISGCSCFSTEATGLNCSQAPKGPRWNSGSSPPGSLTDLTPSASPSWSS